MIFILYEGTECFFLPDCRLGKMVCAHTDPGELGQCWSARGYIIGSHVGPFVSLFQHGSWAFKDMIEVSTSPFFYWDQDSRRAMRKGGFY